MTEANFLQALGWAILNSFWQLALLWVIYQLCIAVYPGAKPAVKSRLASSLLFSGFGWFLLTLIIGLGLGVVSTDLFSTAASNDTLLGRVNNIIRLSLPYASIVYLALLIIPLLRFTRNYRYVQVIRRNGLSKMDAEWRLFVNKVAAHMGIKRSVQVWVSEWVNSPVTIGFLKPIILVPIAAINHLSISQMEAILLHELSHIRRMDYLMNLLLSIIRVILYFNPFAKAFVRIVETEREKSCDEMVLQFQYDSHDYVSALLTLEKVSRHNQVLVVAAAGHHTDLLSRVEIMLGVKKNKKFSLRQAKAIIAGLLVVICVNALMLVTRNSTNKVVMSYVQPIKASADGKKRETLAENPEQVISHAIRQSSPAPAGNNLATAPPPPPASGIIASNFDMPLQKAILSKDQEVQVKQALQASRKLLENAQWKQVERSLADAFSEEEKAQLKNEWRKEVNKFDWKKWESKLRNAYDNVDWNRVNTQLNYAVRQIQADSLMTVYDRTISELHNIEKELSQDSMKGIPDTDITLQSIAEKQKQVQKAMRELKGIRNKKIVQL